MDTPKPPSGQDVWQAIKEELTNNLYDLPFSRLAPTRYHVYLHPDDYDHVEGIVPRIIAEVERALTREVQGINQNLSRRAGRFWTGLRPNENPTPIEVPPDGWEIYIQPDQDEELSRGALGVESKLTMPAAPEYSGTPTIRVVKTVFADGRRTTTMTEVPATTRATSDGGRATLTYEDDEGPHVFIMRKDCIKVGRGGSGAWVDVQVMTDPKVSREHCRIRWDGSGRYFIQDVSTWGTSVDGVRVPAALRSAEGVVMQEGAETELRTGARVRLADTLDIQFDAKVQP